jgi:hypothetical protein
MTEFTQADAEAMHQAFIERLRRPLPEHVQTDLSACTAIDSLSVSLKALRMALESANNALGVLGLPDEDGHLTEGCEMRSRWCAATHRRRRRHQGREDHAGVGIATSPSP